jgi:hypothetical protein
LIVRAATLAVVPGRRFNKFAAIAGGGVVCSSALSADEFRRAIKLEENTEADKLVDRLVQAQIAAVKERRGSFQVVLNSSPSNSVMIKIKDAFPTPGWNVQLLQQHDRNETNLFIKVSLAELDHKHHSI